MADFVRITQSMAEQGLDALLALGMRNCAYLAGAVSEGPWLNEPQGLAPWMTCLIPPDRSFTFGSRFRDTDLPVGQLSARQFPCGAFDGAGGCRCASAAWHGRASVWIWTLPR